MATRQKVRLGVLFFLVLTFPITMNYFSPVLALSAASEGVVSASLIFWASFAGLSLLLGRAICGWLCPLGAFQEVKDRVVPEALHPHSRLHVLKYVLAIGWVGALIALAAVGGGFTKVDLLYLTESGVSVDRAQGWFAYGVIACIVLAPAFFSGRRAFCRYVCPWSVLNIAGLVAKTRLRLPSLHVSADATLCTRCGLCEKTCPMTLPVREMVATGDTYHRECIYCGSCIDACPEKAIAYRWGRPRRTAEIVT